MRRTLLALLLLLTLSACNPKADTPVQWAQMEPVGQMELDYATRFQVDYYENGLSLLTIPGEGRFLLLPEGTARPEGLSDDIPVIPLPCERIYLAASSAMDLFRAIDALDHVTLTSTRAEDWAIEGIPERMASGQLTYAGKYSAPDFELVLAQNCALCIESTMIYHKPQIKEQLERLGIPVLVERSSYEQHPLGRLEWIKLYGLLTGREAEAQALFQAQADAVSQLQGDGGTGKTAVVFYVTASGAVNVRCGGDYVSNMIALAGGTYLLQDTDTSARSSMTMQMEEFYTKARDADILIYNSTVGGELTTMDELLSLSPLFADFKAVQTGAVWCTGQNLFQQTSAVWDTVSDFHTVFSGGDSERLRYLHPLKGRAAP